LIGLRVDDLTDHRTLGHPALFSALMRLDRHIATDYNKPSIDAGLLFLPFCAII
jgi:hypothetical protein